MRPARQTPRGIGAADLLHLHRIQKPAVAGLFAKNNCRFYSTTSSVWARLARFAARFSTSVFCGFFLAFFLLSIPLLIVASL